jgi:hypothetical protein
MERRRTIALVAGVGRILIGAPLSARPDIARRWIGDDAAGRASQALTRGLAGRDIALGAGLMAAVIRDEGVPLWLAAGAIADTADLVGTAIAGDALPTRPRIATMALAGAAALVGGYLAATWDRR